MFTSQIVWCFNCMSSNITRTIVIGILLTISVSVMLTVKSIVDFPRFLSDPTCPIPKINSLSDISHANPRKGESIFFLDTSCPADTTAKILISAKYACSVEAAARKNPKHDVYLLFTSGRLIKDSGTESDAFINILLSFPNVKIHQLSYNITKGTPMENFLENRVMKSSKYPVEHSSEILRYVLLWKYGGIFLDLDVIVLKTLALPPNYAGTPHDLLPCNSVLNLAPTNSGRHVAEMCLNHIKRDYKEDVWQNNKAGDLLRTFRHVCHRPNDEEATCKEFRLYPPEMFYPVPWWFDFTFLKLGYDKNILNATSNSYAVKTWNYINNDEKIEKHSPVAYNSLARKHCPMVFSAAHYM